MLARLLSWNLVAIFCDVALDPAAAGAGNGGAAAVATQTQSVATGTQAKPPANAQAFAAEIMQHITPGLQALVQAEIKPIADQAQALTTQLDEARKPVRQAAAVFGGGAGNGGVIVGERSSSRGFQYQRVIGYQQGLPQYESGEQCKVEREFCRDLRQLYSQAGLSMDGLNHSGREPMLCVLDSNYIPDEFKQQLSQKFGDLKVFIKQGMQGASPDEMRWLAKKTQAYGGQMQQALSQFDDSGMGIFLEPGPHGEMIEYIRPREALTKAGVRDIALPPNGYLPFGSQTGQAAGYWVGESEQIIKSQPTTGRKEMRAKKAAALVQIPNELFKFASGTTEAFIRSDVGMVIALLEDKAGLEGVGTDTQPRGIRNYAGVTKHTRTLVIGTNGNQFEPRTASAMIVDVENLNYDVETDGWAWIMRSPMWEELTTRRAVMYSGGGETGPYLFPVQTTDLSKGINADTLRGWPVVKSGQISNTLTKGSSSALSYVVGGIFRNLLRGRVGVIEFAMATQGDSLFPNYISQLRAIDFIDYMPRYESCFNIADLIDMTLPNG